MGIIANVGYNDPALGQVAANIAQMFGPPPASDLAAYSTARVNNQKAKTAEQLAQMALDRSNFDQQTFDRLNVAGGNYAPTSSYYAQDQDNATAQRGQDVAASTSAANNLQDNQFRMLIDRYGTADPDHSAPVMPGDIAGMFHLPELPARLGQPTPLTQAQVLGEATQQLSEDDLHRLVMGNTPVESIVGEAGTPVIQYRTDAVGQQPAPRAPLVSVAAGESAYDREVGSGMGKTYLGLQEQATAARSTLDSLSTMESALSDDNFYSGIGGDQVAALKRTVVAMGGDPESVKSIETFNAAASQAALANMGGTLGAGFSNADRDFVMRMVPNLGTTKAGNLALIEIHKAMAQRKMEIAALADQYAEQNGGRLDSGFNAYLTQWAELHPMMPKPSDPQADAPAAAHTPSSFSQYAVNPHTGERLMLQNGQWVPIQ